MREFTITLFIYIFIPWQKGASKQNSYDLYLLIQFKLENRHHFLTLMSFPNTYFLSFMAHKKRSFAECPCCSFLYNHSDDDQRLSSSKKGQNSTQSTQLSHYLKFSKAFLCKKDLKNLSCYSLKPIVMITIHFYCIEMTNLDILLQIIHFTFYG